MGSIYKALLTAGLVCSLYLQATKADVEADVRVKFGKEIGEAMQRISMDMLKEYIQSAEDFYHEFIMDLEPTGEQSQKINELMSELNTLKTKIPVNNENLNATKMSELFREFGTNYMKIIKMEANDKSKNEEQKEALYMAVARFVQLEAEVADNAIKKMHKKWLELYEKLPAVELKKHVEYGEINEAVDKLSKIDRMRMKRPTERNDLFKAMFMQMVDFFNWTEWKNFFQTNKV